MSLSNSNFAIFDASGTKYVKSLSTSNNFFFPLKSQFNSEWNEFSPVESVGGGNYNTESERKKNEFKNLKNWNVFMGVVHLASFIALLVLFIVYYNKIPKSASYTDFAYTTNSRIFLVDFQLVNSYNLLWVLLPFPLITAFFHFFIAFFGFKVYIYNLYVYGIQYYRWIEYSITASLMTWVIYALSGGTNILLGLILVILNVNMNFFGYVMEYVNSNVKPSQDFLTRFNNDLDKVDNTNEFFKYKCICISKDDDDTSSDIAEETLSDKTNENAKNLSLCMNYDNGGNNAKTKVVWWPLVLGFINFGIIWLVLLLYFFSALGKSQNIVNIPWFVWTIDIGLFFQFLTFGLIMIFHYWARYSSSKSMFIQFFKKRYHYELSYQILSLTSKTFLVWFLFGGILGEQ